MAPQQLTHFADHLPLSLQIECLPLQSVIKFRDALVELLLRPCRVGVAHFPLAEQFLTRLSQLGPQPPCFDLTGVPSLLQLAYARRGAVPREAVLLDERFQVVDLDFSLLDHRWKLLAEFDSPGDDDLCHLFGGERYDLLKFHGPAARPADFA